MTVKVTDVALGLVVGVLVLFAVVPLLVPPFHRDPAPIASSLTAPSAPPPGAEHEVAMSRKNAMIERCERNDAGVAVIGFGTKVVCVKPLWVEDPDFPRYP